MLTAATGATAPYHDPARPEVLLYDLGPAGELVLAGVAFQLPVADPATPPASFSSVAHWHQHDYHRPCLTPRTEGNPRTARIPDAECRARGGVVIPVRFWMLHLWLHRPGVDGLFAENNGGVGLGGHVTGEVPRG